MTDNSRIIGYIIAGGSARRMGGTPKSFVELAGKPLIARVIERLRPQVDAILINSNLPPERFTSYGAEVLPDADEGGEGPLAGLLAAMTHAAGLDPRPPLIATVPGDCPFLPSDLVARLASAMGDADAAVADFKGRTHPLCGLWRTNLLPRLQNAFEGEGLRAMRDFAASVEAVHAPFPDPGHDPFFNVNTPDDLSRAGALARKLGL